MRFLEATLLDMSIDLRRANIRMTKHQLNRPQIRSAIQQVRGE